jgi:isoleucyl-tRNA synthetase
MDAVRSLAAAGLAERAEAGIKVRQPLASMTVNPVFTKDLQKILADEVNVKEILSSMKLNDGEVVLDTKITAELREEGLMRELARTVQELRQKAGLQPKDKIALLLDLPAATKDSVVKNEKALKADVGASIIEHGSTDKFTAEATTKLEEQEAWIGIRKI